MKQIKFNISPTGQTKIATSGYEGESCRDATKAFEQALGLKTSDTPTDEMFRTTTETQAEAQE